MPLCGQCGAHTDDALGLCPHHDIKGLDWAALNRMACDFFHRGVEQPNVPIGLEEYESLAP